MPPDFVERLAALKNIRYVKESTGDMSRITELLRRCGDRIGIFCGCDTLALESLLMGAVGWVGGVVNVLPVAHARLYDLTVNQQDLASARELFFKMLPTLELMESQGKYTQFVKAGCKLMGHDVGNPRAPLQAATSEENRLLRRALKLVPEERLPAGQLRSGAPSPGSGQASGGMRSSGLGGQSSLPHRSE
jgi:4-hydroxy-tetrahydrodipicolinate synthase